MFRNATLHRAIASFFLLELVGSLAAPSLSYALMGPGQPEFTSYESASSPDMVNLSTGDMTYNVPVLEVPGPETTFSLPLTYRAGIRPEQEASWVGLGWSMNPGAIVRNVNGYPDDAAGELATSSYTDPGHRGWYGGLPGVLQLGWDSETGHSGSASLLSLVNASWSGGKLQSGDIIGVGATRGEGFGLNAANLVSGFATLSTLGAASALSVGAKVALQAAGAVIGGVGIAALGKLGPTGGGFVQPTINKEHTWFRTNYWIFVNDTTKESMFGSLYFDRMARNVDTSGEFGNANNYGPNVYDGPGNYPNNPRKAQKFNYNRTTTDQGNFALETASDIQQTNYPNQDYRVNTQGPASIAHDDFTVMGPGISGSIRPQRLDMGTFAYPHQMVKQHDKYYLVPWQSYKVPFRYENTASNAYTYNSNASAASTSAPVGVDPVKWQNSQLLLTDPKIYDETKTTAAARTEANRKGLTNRQLVQGKYVEWFSNKEINDGYNTSPVASPILEYAAGLNNSVSYQVPDGYNKVLVPGQGPGIRPQYIYEPKYRTETKYFNNYFRATRPGDGVGAFAVTAEDGTVYHYSLPVYHLRQFSKTVPLDNSVKGVATTRRGGGGAEVYNYATAWLLTSITSPDYVDRGTIGVVDEQDLGTWVKFSYGKFSKQFKWRQPYVGTEVSPGSTGKTYQEGAKETYYLNSITTRTHTALFIKSVRQDGRGHYTPGRTNASASDLGIVEATPASSLRLDEIIVLSNQDLQSIKATTGFGENTNTNSNAQNTALGTGDSFAEVLDQNDINANSAIRPVLNQKAVKRVVFNYSYRLCVGAPNSFASAAAAPALSADTYSAAGRLGKLTLESIATYGSNNVKIIPDYRFDYQANPKYAPDKWDWFGMYSNSGTATNHTPSTDFAQATQDGAAWSLTKITSPLGAVTTIQYERDQYASISEIGNEFYYLQDQGSSEPNGILEGGGFDFTTIYKPGDVVYVKEDIVETYSYTETPTSGGYPVNYDGDCHSLFDNKVKIIAVTPTSITIENFPGRAGYESRCVPQNNRDYTYSSGLPVYGGCRIGFPIPLNRNGGDIRVASVTTSDENNHAYSIKYQYGNSLPTGRNSSGVLSKEPEYGQQNKYWFYDLFDYPITPVMYGQTTILRGNFTKPDDIDQREEYAFYTANSSMVQAASQKVNTPNTYWANGSVNNPTLQQRSNDITINIGLLGQAKSIRKYNRRGTVEFSTVFNYTNTLSNADGIANQGVYSEGGILSELLDAFYDASATDHYFSVYNLNWTTKHYLPTVLASMTTTTNNIAATTTQKLYDFYSGALLESSLRNSLGDAYRSKTVPAYTVYPSMGPRSEGVGNQHMLSQTAGVYTYKENGTANPSVLAAGIQTWKNDWASYRVYDPASDSYRADPAANASIYRQHRTFVWQSPRLNPDGTFASFVPYQWNQPKQAAAWLNAGEVTLYDHYSRPLESKDVNGKYTTQKAGYDQSQVLAAAPNARYTEVAYSGAEDVVATGTSSGHFGGEVRDGGRQSADQHHTGLYSSLLTPSGSSTAYGFTYKAVVGDANDLSVNRTYRASVWVYNSDVASSSTNGARLYITLNGTTLKEVSIADATTKRAGNWYLLNLYADLPASVTGQQLMVGCRNAGSANIYVDDFRFHPLDAPLQANVYDPATRQLTYSLDNDNLYTCYQYDDAGKVVKVYKEVLTPNGSTADAKRLVKETSYNYAQLRTPNWLDLGTSCATNASGQTTGYLVHTYRDVNSASPTYNQESKQYTTASSVDCPATACSGFDRYNNSTQTCESPTQTLISCYVDNNKHFGIYRYVYRDGSCYQNQDGSCYEFSKIVPNWQTICPDAY